MNFAGHVEQGQSEDTQNQNFYKSHKRADV